MELILFVNEKWGFVSVAFPIAFSGAVNFALRNTESEKATDALSEVKHCIIE
jgi:hypothetical protein